MYILFFCSNLYRYALGLISKSCCYQSIFYYNFQKSHLSHNHSVCPQNHRHTPPHDAPTLQQSIGQPDFSHLGSSGYFQKGEARRCNHIASKHYYLIGRFLHTRLWHYLANLASSPHCFVLP